MKKKRTETDMDIYNISQLLRIQDLMREEQKEQYQTNNPNKS